jgi:hypothetical protein
MLALEEEISSQYSVALVASDARRCARRLALSNCHRGVIDRMVAAYTIGVLVLSLGGPSGSGQRCFGSVDGKSSDGTLFASTTLAL